VSCLQSQSGDGKSKDVSAIAPLWCSIRTLVMLWQVSDRSTAALMGQFYKELTKREVTKTQALHQAQLALFKQ
jgi:hypothetical protein